MWRIMRHFRRMLCGARIQIVIAATTPAASRTGTWPARSRSWVSSAQRSVASGPTGDPPIGGERETVGPAGARDRDRGGHPRRLARVEHRKKRAGAGEHDLGGGGQRERLTGRGHKRQRSHERDPQKDSIRHDRSGPLEQVDDHRRPAPRRIEPQLEPRGRSDRRLLAGTPVGREPAASASHPLRESSTGTSIGIEAARPREDPRALAGVGEELAQVELLHLAASAASSGARSGRSIGRPSSASRSAAGAPAIPIRINGAAATPSGHGPEPREQLGRRREPLPVGGELVPQPVALATRRALQQARFLGSRPPSPPCPLRSARPFG